MELWAHWMYFVSSDEVLSSGGQMIQCEQDTWLLYMCVRASVCQKCETWVKPQMQDLKDQVCQDCLSRVYITNPTRATCLHSKPHERQRVFRTGVSKTRDECRRIAMEQAVAYWWRTLEMPLWEKSVAPQTTAGSVVHCVGHCVKQATVATECVPQ